MLRLLAERISNDIADILRQPAVIARLRELLIEPVGTTPAQARQFFLDETTLWGKVIADTGAKLE